MALGSHHVPMVPMGFPLVPLHPPGVTTCPHGPGPPPWPPPIPLTAPCPRVPAVLQSWSIQQDGPISTVLLFPLEEPDDDGDEGGGQRGDDVGGRRGDDVGPSAPGPEPSPHYSLLVASTIEMAVVYR